MEPSTFLLMDLPRELRDMIWIYSLDVGYIRDNEPELPPPKEIPTFEPDISALDYSNHYRDHTSPFDISDTRTGNMRRSGLSRLLSLTLVSRQVREETKLLVWQLNVFHVSSHHLHEFTAMLPTEVGACIKQLGILNNKQLHRRGRNYGPKVFKPLIQLPALKDLILVRMGGWEAGHELTQTKCEVIVGAQQWEGDLWRYNMVGAWERKERRSESKAHDVAVRPTLPIWFQRT